MTMDESAMLVETKGLTKRYGSFTALSDCTLSVGQGEVFGLLGPNGSGKSTLLRTLMGYLTPTAGNARINGLDCHTQSTQVRKLVSYLPGDARLFRRMRGLAVVRLFQGMRPGNALSRYLLLAEQLSLDLGTRVAEMSTGMRQKLALVVTLGADVPLYILDEPTSNLDPLVRDQVVSLVRQAKQAGHSVLFSSHILPEIEEVADRAAILHHGKLLRVVELAPLIRKREIKGTLTGPRPELPRELQGVEDLSNGAAGILHLATDDVLPVLRWLAQLPLTDLRIEATGLKSAYEAIRRENGH